MSGLLNYTTSISAAKTVGEIQSKLAKAGAHQILHEYDGAGNVSALSFRIETRFGDMTFRLPANIEAVEKILAAQYREGRVSRKFMEKEQATRVGWRILKDWVEAQLALIETGMVTVEQVFLPYAQNAAGQTIYEALLEKKFSGLALPAPSSSQKVVNIEARK
jgi:hypothetical protein